MAVEQSLLRCLSCRHREQARSHIVLRKGVKKVKNRYRVP